MNPRTDPSCLLRLRDGLYAPDLLITAVAHLDLFNRLAGGQANRMTAIDKKQTASTNFRARKNHRSR